MKCPECGHLCPYNGASLALYPTPCKDCWGKRDNRTRATAVFYDFFVGEKRLEFEVDRLHERFWIPKAKGLGKGNRRVHGRWTPVKIANGLEIYLSCPVCGGANNLTDCDVNERGACECFHCGQCGTDLYVSLEGWAPYRGLEPGAMPKFITSQGRAYSFEEMEDRNGDNYDYEEGEDEDAPDDKK